MVYATGMDAEAAIAILRAHRPESEATGMAHAGVSGAAARGEAGPAKDRPAVAATGRAHRQRARGLRHDLLWRGDDEALPPLSAAVEAGCNPRR